MTVAIGDIFGLLRTVAYDSDSRSWDCVCTRCGATPRVLAYNLRLLKLGCRPCSYRDRADRQLIDLSGLTFGSLTVVERTSRASWLCVCSCGKQRAYRTTALMNEGVISCHKCSLKRSGERNRKNVAGDIPNTWWTALRKNALTRGYEFTLEPEYAANLLAAQRYRCALSGEPIGFRVDRYTIATHNNKHTASIDRIDNDQGYTNSNVQWVHGRVNVMKMADSQTDFILWCKKIAERNNQ